jgi:hypothetical protein
MEKVTVLYVDEKSLYKSDSRFDCWDLYRDARLYTGKAPIIAHPPCRLFSKLHGLSTAASTKMDLAYRSIWHIQTYGGILEHPKSSKLWDIMNLPTGLQIDKFGGFTLCVDLHWFGADVRKPTLLYICGIRQKDLPSIPISFDMPKKRVDQLRYGSRAVTPSKMINWFYKIMIKIIDEKTKGR